MSHVQARTPARTRSVDHDDGRSSLHVPDYRSRCEGDLSYLCEDYGCARKGGLSPHSEENA